MGKVKDLIGQRFGRLTVISRAENDKYGKTRWYCKCDCGAKCIMRGCHLTSGHSASCGCLAKEIRTSHSMSRTKIYCVWISIKQRCLNHFNLEYHNYGERGITIYPEWINNFLAFYDYVSNLEHFGEKGYSLDRIDNNGNYEPGNLRWANSKTQSCNTRKNVFVEYNGVEMCLKDVSKLSGINYTTLQGRYNRGDRGEKLFRPVAGR